MFMLSEHGLQSPKIAIDVAAEKWVNLVLAHVRSKRLGNIKNKQSIKYDQLSK